MLRHYRAVVEVPINGLGEVEFVSDPISVYGTPQQVASRFATDMPTVTRIEEFINGQWVLV